VPIFLKLGSLNLLEPSGPVKVCNGIAMPLPCLKLLIEEVRNFNLETHLLSIDYEKAFDKVQRQISLNNLKLRLTVDIFLKVTVDLRLQLRQSVGCVFDGQNC
jgi:hypothetical protein